MQYFAEHIIVPVIQTNHYRHVCEIGAMEGGNTDRILSDTAARITVVDPCLDCDLSAKYHSRDRIMVVVGDGLSHLARMTDPADCFLIDGDHNWYTVFHELQTIHNRRLLKAGGLIFLHDVVWPYARRDMYYQPEAIPEEYRHPHARRGIRYGRSDLIENGGVNARYWNACHEGGPRNGVLTAIEDFMASEANAYAFVRIERQFGLGLLYRADAPPALPFSMPEKGIRTAGRMSQE